MKKASSCTSYSQFRKKNLIKQGISYDILNLQEIDIMSKQLQAIGVKNKKAIEQKFQQQPHNIIQEVDEEDMSYLTQNKVIKGSEAKLGKMLNAKQSNPIKKKGIQSSHKMNKSLEVSYKGKNSQVNTQIQHRPVNSCKVASKKQPSLIARRMSLTGGINDNNQKQFWSTTTTSTNFMPVYADNNQKKQLLTQLEKISHEINTKNIPQNHLEELVDKFDAILAFLNTIE